MSITCTLCTICKCIILVLLLVTGCMVYISRDDIRSTAANLVPRSEAAVMYQGKIQNMDDIMMGYLKKYPDIKAVSVYKFIPYNGSALFKGQMNILTSYRDSDFSLDDWKPELHALDSSLQDVLFNKVHYETITSVRVGCEKIYTASSTFTCEKYKVISEDFRSVVTIPIMDTRTFSITGYVMVLLEKEYDNTQVQSMVSEIRPYIDKIQPFVNSISKDEIPKK